MTDPVVTRWPITALSRLTVLGSQGRRMPVRSHDFPAAVVGCVAVATALIIIWIARAVLLREAYVSELGAVGEPTAKWFQVALLLIVGGGSAIAWAGRRIRSTARVLRAWAPSVSLWVGCGFFLLASQVTCTARCPLPIGVTFTWQDFVHTIAAVLAFAAACIAMLQLSFAAEHPRLARLSLVSGLAVASIAAAGGILSLARFGTNVGSVLELIATTIAIGWLVVFGVEVAARSVSGSEPVTPAPGLREAPGDRSRFRPGRSTGTRALR